MDRSLSLKNFIECLQDYSHLAPDDTCVITMDKQGNLILPTWRLENNTFVIDAYDGKPDYDPFHPYGHLPVSPDFLADMCTMDTDFGCPCFNTGCPFTEKDCTHVTAEHWAKVLEEKKQ